MRSLTGSSKSEGGKHVVCHITNSQLITADLIVQLFPSSIHFLPQLIRILSPPSSPTSSTTPSTLHHPLIASSEAWETRAVLLIWLALLLTVPFSLSALSSEPVNSTFYGIDQPSSKLLFSSPLSELAKEVILLSLQLLRKAGKEGSYAALVLARVYSRTDCVQALPGFLLWAEKELEEGESESEANLVTSLLEFMALLPGMLPFGHLDQLMDYMEEKLLPHLRGSRTAAESGLIRKLVVKARGRLWITKLGQVKVEEGIEGLEDFLEEFMGGLADKVRHLFLHLAHC